MEKEALPDYIIELRNELTNVIMLKIKAVKDQKYEEASQLRARETEIKEALEDYEK